MTGGPPPAAIRCFVAVLPPPDLVERLRSMDRPARRGLRWTPEAQWHVTLKFFAAVHSDALLDALDRWSSSPPGPPAARATTGTRPRPLGGRVWMVVVNGLEGLAAAVDAATAGLGAYGAADPGRPFRGHLTLARARDPAALGGLPQPDLRVSWQAEEVVAFASRLGRHGARHHVLGRWALPSRAPLHDTLPER